jgi:hypothetical protein
MRESFRLGPATPGYPGHFRPWCYGSIPGAAAEALVVLGGQHINAAVEWCRVGKRQPYRERMRRVVRVERRLHAVAVRRKAGRLFRCGQVPHPEVGQREVVLSERGPDEARDTLEREPEFVIDEGECERYASPVQPLDAIPERLEHGLPQYARLVHVAFEAKVSDEFVHITYVEQRPVKPPSTCSLGQSARQWSRLSTSNVVSGPVDTRESVPSPSLFGKSPVCLAWTPSRVVR